MGKTSKDPILDPMKLLSMPLQKIVDKLDDPILLFGLGITLVVAAIILFGKATISSSIIAMILGFGLIVVGIYFFYKQRSTPPPPPPEEQDHHPLIEALIEQGILATCECHAERSSIYQLDKAYWTNLSINFRQLEQNDELLNSIVKFILQHYLRGKVGGFITPDPISFIDLTNEKEKTTIGVVKKITSKIGIPVKEKVKLRDQDKLVVIAGIYSKSLRKFLIEFSSNIQLVAILLAPKNEYFINEQIIDPNKIKVLVSRDSLEPLSEAKRKFMIKQE